jgi:hypothetical protein
VSLLFVEGAPGTGKSTTAQFLAVHSSRHGRPARWVYEEETPHPIFGTQADTSSWDAYFAQSVERWRLFTAQAHAAGDITVVDSALLQRPIFTLLREDVAPETALAFLARVGAVVRDADPVLLYLSHADRTAAFRALCAQRGDGWVADHVRRLEASPFGTRRGVGGLGDWNGERTVDLDAAGLRLHDVLWPANRLRPKAGNVFYAEAWPIEVAFEESPAGAVRVLRVVENRVRSSRLQGVYEKVG